MYLRSSSLAVALAYYCVAQQAACVREGREPAAVPMSTLTVTGGRGGRVVSEPGGISCGTVCDGRFRRGSVVTLRAEADPGTVFAGWGGACRGAALCAVAMQRNATVTAHFVLVGSGKPVPQSWVRYSDLDNDGIPDGRDGCPVEAGSGDGCPATAHEVGTRLDAGAMPSIEPMADAGAKLEQP